MAASHPDEPTAPRPGIKDRLLGAMLKQETKSAKPNPIDQITTVDEAETAIAVLNPTERLIGLFAPPLGGIAAILVTGSLLNNDPKATLVNGAVNHKHVAPGTYLAVGATSMLLCLLMLASAWFNKRLFLGITSALLGLSFFNLHFWAFGLPFLLFGSWYLVRAYRLHQKMKELQGGGALDPPGGGKAGGPKARPNKRFTPPTNS